MTMVSEVPSTESVTIARMAVAWNIVVSADYYNQPPSKRYGEEMRDTLLKAYIDTYNAILANERQRAPTAKMR